MAALHPALMLTDPPLSRAGSLLQLGWVHSKEIGRLAGRHREQARSYSGSAYVCERLVGWQAAIASKLAPTEEQRQSAYTAPLLTTHQAER